MFLQYLIRYAAVALGLWNLAVFVLYGADKAKACRGRRRVRERTLLICALALGGAGAMAGMLVFRHKTRHRVFRVLLPLALVLTCAAAALLVYGYVRLGGL